MKIRQQKSPTVFQASVQLSGIIDEVMSTHVIELFDIRNVHLRIGFLDCTMKEHVS